MVSKGQPWAPLGYKGVFSYFQRVRGTLFSSMERGRGGAMDDVYEAEAMQSGGDETSVPSVQESGARRLAGAADVCELLSVAFRFPEEDALAVALVDGRFAADAQGAFSDAGASAEALAASDELLASFRGLNAAALQRDLRAATRCCSWHRARRCPSGPTRPLFAIARKAARECRLSSAVR